MTPQPDARYDLKELAARAGVTARTVHFYIQQGLLPPAGQSGPGARYSEAHLARLILIRRLQREHLPLAEIRHRLSGLDDEAVRQLVASAPPPGAPKATPRETSALDYVRGILGQSLPSPRTAVSRLYALREELDSQASWRARTEPEQETRSASTAPAPRPAPGARSPEPAPLAPSIERSQWERLVLSPDIELHIRRPLTRDQNRRVERLVHAAREILQEGEV